MQMKILIQLYRNKLLTESPDNQVPDRTTFEVDVIFTDIFFISGIICIFQTEHAFSYHPDSAHRGSKFRGLSAFIDWHFWLSTTHVNNKT